MDGTYVSERLQASIKLQSLTIEAKSGATRPNSCSKLFNSVWSKMKVIGETDETKAVDAICGYADVLCKSWHGTDVMADRIIKRYYGTHAYPDKAGGTGDGQSENRDDLESQEAEADDRQEGQGGGRGDDGTGDDSDGDSEGEGEGGDDGQGDESGEQEGGSGEGDEESEGEGDGSRESPGGECEDEVSEELEAEGADPEPPEEESQYEFEDGWIPPEDFDQIIEAVKMGKNVALYGPAGCGKTDIMMHVGMALGKPYYITTAPQMPYDLVGFVDGHGTYTETSFSVPFMRGGIAGLDEMDRASPEALIAVNAPIANGTMFVPKLGQFQKNPDCIFMATLNTAGLGADLEYVTANQLDASTRDRFVWFKVGYDERVDMAVAKQDRYLVDFARDWRQACQKAEVYNAIFSYRVLKDFKDLCDSPAFGVTAAIEKTLLKGGVPKDTCLTIMRYFEKNNRYHKALKIYVDGMEE